MQPRIIFAQQRLFTAKQPPRGIRDPTILGERVGDPILRYRWLTTREKERKHDTF